MFKQQGQHNLTWIEMTYITFHYIYMYIIRIVLFFDSILTSNVSQNSIIVLQFVLVLSFEFENN